MSWANLPATQATDWSHVDFLQQFCSAIHERAEVVGLTSSLPPATVTVGTDVQHKSFVFGLQSALERMAVRFMNPSVSIAGLGANPDWASEVLFSLADWRAAAGLNASGFTRKFPDGMGGVTTAFGTIESGDYIGPWIWNELQAGINALTTTLSVYPVSNIDGIGPGSAVSTKWGQALSGLHSTIAAAKSAAESNYSISDSGVELRFAIGLRYVTARRRSNGTTDFSASTQYRAPFRITAPADAPLLESDLTADVTAWAYTTTVDAITGTDVVSAEFDNWGEPWADDAWVVVVAGTDLELQPAIPRRAFILEFGPASPEFSELAWPSVDPTLPPSTGDNTHTRGCRLVNQASTIVWHFAYGSA